jgi:hypothetical protein
MSGTGSIRRRPLVFLSSTITDLREIRDQLAVDLAALKLVDEWRFETHASASGSPPESQYLERARASDVFVLLVAERASDATRAEYDAAYDDNRFKVLPFLLGLIQVLYANFDRFFGNDTPSHTTNSSREPSGRCWDSQRPSTAISSYTR